MDRVSLQRQRQIQVALDRLENMRERWSMVVVGEDGIEVPLTHDHAQWKPLVLHYCSDRPEPFPEHVLFWRGDPTAVPIDQLREHASRQPIASGREWFWYQFDGRVQQAHCRVEGCATTLCIEHGTCGLLTHIRRHLRNGV